MASKRKDSKGRVLHTGERETQKKNKDGALVSYYTYQYNDVTGKRASISASDLATLREKEKALQGDFFDGLKTGREKNKTTAEMVDIYLATKINLKPTTAGNYRYMAEQYIKPSKIGKMLIKDVKKSDVQKYYGELLQNGFKPNSVETLQTILHPAFQRAIDDGYIRLNPTQGVIAELKKSEYWVKPKRHALTIAEQEAFIAFIKGHPIYEHWAPLFTFFLGTGCRVGEALGLTWDDVDLKAGVVTIRHNLVHRTIDHKTGLLMNSPKTDAGAREIPMLREVKAALKETRVQQLKTGGAFMQPVEIEGRDYNLVFRNRYGEALIPSGVNRAIDRIVRDFNAQEIAQAEAEHREPLVIRDFSVHQLRHTFATRLCESSSNLKAIQDIMGHASIETTMDVYAEATKEAKRETLDDMEGRFKIG